MKSSRARAKPGDALQQSRRAVHSYDRGSRARAWPPVPFRRTAANQFQYGRSAVRCWCARAVLFRCSSACDGVWIVREPEKTFFLLFIFSPPVAIFSFQGGAVRRRWEPASSPQSLNVPKRTRWVFNNNFLVENTTVVAIESLTLSTFATRVTFDDDDAGRFVGNKFRRFVVRVRNREQTNSENRPRKYRRNSVPRVPSFWIIICLSTRFTRVSSTSAWFLIIAFVILTCYFWTCSYACARRLPPPPQDFSSLWFFIIPINSKRPQW